MSETCKCGLLVEGKDVEVPLKESKIHVSVKGFIANVECQLTYVNDSSDPLQTSFVFPMDDMSAVYKFEADVNKKRIIAECQDKKKAKETYNEAISSGHTAMLLSEDDTAGDIFECKLGNLPAGETAQLTMSYVVELSVEPGGKMKFTLPTVLNPRYFPEVGHLVEAGSDPTPGQINIKKPCKLTFRASINGRHNIRSVTSAKDKLYVTVSDDKLSASIKLDEEFKFDHDLSLDIIYDDINKPEIIVELGDPNKDGLLKEDILMLNFYPDFKQGRETEDSKREFIFVIDRSGSMDGDRIKKAKETLLLLLKSLPVGCLFNVVSFGSEYSSLFDKSQEYSEKSLKEAIELQKKMEADMGGTEILEPLKSIYSQSCKQGYPRQIFLLTDGGVGNTNDVVSLVGKNKGNTRVFTFGIGDGASTSLIKNVAKASNGKAIFIKDQENMQAKVISAMKGSLEHCLSEVNLEWKIPKCFKVTEIPSQPPMIFHGDKLVLFALLKSSDKQGKISGSFCLKGTFGGETITHTVSIQASSDSHPDLPLHRVAAKYQIKDLEVDDGSYGSDGVNKDKIILKIILVSQAANIASKYTAFVGVDKDSKVPVSVKEVKFPQFMTGACSGIKYCAPRGMMCRSAPRRYCSSTTFSAPDDTVNFRKLSLEMESYQDTLQMLCDEDDESYDPVCVDLKKYEKKKENTIVDIMMEVVSLQNFDGSWSPSNELALVLNVDEKELKSKYKGNIWCTAVVMIFLQKKYSERHTEWQMIYDKGMKWMISQDKDGKTVEQILQEVEDSDIVKTF